MNELRALVERLADMDENGNGRAIVADAERLFAQTLDAAWADAEAALPEGWTFSLSRAIRPVAEDAEPTYYATVSAPWAADGIKFQVGGPSPAAALRALAAKRLDEAMG